MIAGFISFKSLTLVHNSIPAFSIGMLLLLSSCYKELEECKTVEVSDRNKEVFELSVSPGMQEIIYSSRDSSYSINEPGLSLRFNDRLIEIKDIRVRGRTTLDFKRKSYSVFLKNSIFTRGRDGIEIKELKKFKLISLSMDYTYIKNRLAFGILEREGIMPLFYKYVEVKINGDTQGVYFLVEDPEEFAKEQGSEFILRRDYHRAISDAEYSPELYSKPREEYEQRFREIYSLLTVLKGEILFEALSQRIDMNQYFRKMGIDFLLQNGDYSDEIYLYTTIEQDAIRYKIIPWDYDDIFSKYPHEVGRSWGIGSLFGERYYDSHQDILDEIGDKMIFSIEDDLDYAVAIDSFLYARYKNTLADLISDMEVEDIRALFDQVEFELTPFYSDRDLILQSQYDKDPSSHELWQNNMMEKQSLLEERLQFMKSQLLIQEIPE